MIEAEKHTALAKAETMLSGKRVLVVGLGRTGIALSKFLQATGALVTATDALPASRIPGVREIALMGIRVEAGEHKAEEFAGADLIVVSPGVPLSIPVFEDARRAGVEIISDIELAYRLIEAPIVAVAGTNGKSTTTTLIGNVLKSSGEKAFVGGNIGSPAIEYLEREGVDWCVLEVSSFHLEAIKDFRPHIGVLLNVTEDHLDRYRDFNEYAETKLKLFMNQGAEDYAVVNIGDTVIKEAVSGGFTKAKVVPFTASGRLEEGFFLRGKDIVCASGGGREVTYSVEGLKLAGLHNLENVMATMATAMIVGIPMETALETMRGFEGLPHRMEFIREVEGVRFVNDSKGTNVGALKKALEGSGGGIVLIAGGMDKSGDYRPLRDLIKSKVKFLVLMGQARLKMKKALGDATETAVAGGLEDAFELARKKAEPGDTVLLCPACSSFDMFRNFEERGELFRKLVETL
jgi:UDP-N-acetylmuramoylalanine--D-glutamate ligase